MLPLSRIERIRIGPMSSDDIRRLAVSVVSSSELMKADAPMPNGLYDQHLGPIDYSSFCTTCFLRRDECHGHSGVIELPYPVFAPLGLKEIKLWLKALCHQCGKCVMPAATLSSIPAARRLHDVGEKVKSSSKSAATSCAHCHSEHPDITISDKRDREKGKNAMKLAVKYRGRDLITLYPHRVKAIFAQCTYDTVESLGSTVHPLNYIFDCIYVSPVNLRPDSKKSAGGKSSVDAITTKLQAIIKECDKLLVENDNVDEKTEKKIYRLMDVVHSLTRATNDPNSPSYVSRIKGKTGRMRRHLLGKRVFKIIRSIIVGNVHIPIDTIIIPMEVAMTITVQEVYQEYNRNRLYSYFLNAKTKEYPCAVRIIKANREYDAAKVDAIEYGDIILRNLIDGDIGAFNRQPSLMASNISGMKLIINRDLSNKTIMMNPLACPLFNADFDGDAMNVIIHASAGARNEIEQLSALPNWYINQSSSTPAIGLAEDSIVGCALLTKSHIRYNKYHALLLFSGVSFVPKIAGDLTGREVLSLTLAETPISYERGTEFFKEDQGYTKWIKYRADETKCRVERGKVLAGVVDKKAIGKGAAGGLYHLIAHEYGAAKALRVMFDHQQLANGHIFQEGLTIGINDMVVMLGAKDKIDKISANIVAESMAIGERLKSGDIIPPIGKTVEQFYEEQQINALRTLDDFYEAVFGQGDPMANNLLKLIVYGSKGSVENMLNMVSSVGQKLINGERTRQKFGPSRTGPYYRRYDLSPEARGYISNSYLGGTTAAEFVHNASASRFDLITKALTTATTGDQNRKAIKNMESEIIDNLRRVAKGYMLTDLVYGDDYLDPRYVETGRFPLAQISDEAFNQYNADAGEFAELTAGRQWYRGQFLRIEQLNTKELAQFTRLVPFNAERIIQDAAREAPELLGGTGDVLPQIQGFFSRLPYVLSNSTMEKAGKPLPPYVVCASKLAAFHARCFLNLAAMKKLGATPKFIEFVEAKIRRKYIASLISPGTCVGIIAAQSFSEPLTQYMLDSHRRSAQGGTSKSALNRVKEIVKGSAINKDNDTSTMVIQTSDPQGLANKIELISLKSFVESWRIFYEKLGECGHSKYAHEAKAVAEFLSTTKIRPPTDLTKYCIHMTLSKTALILKNISLDDAIHVIRVKFPDVYWVYSQENAAEVFIRGQIGQRALKVVDVSSVADLARSIIVAPIRGVQGIRGAWLGTCLRQAVAPDGSIIRKDTPCVYTLGTNIPAIAVLPEVDALQISTDAIQETARIFGIEAARFKIAMELRNQVEKCNFRHYMMYANEMTSTGQVSSIEMQGLTHREKRNPLLRMGSSHPAQVIESTMTGAVNEIAGVTAPLLIGSTPRVGTYYNEYIVNEAVIRQNMKSTSDIIADLL
jgi:DNA-directed RNA polymerase II subunit RPB1